MWCPTTYLAYLSQATVGGKVFLLAPWDKSVRQAWKKHLGEVLRNPLRLFDKVYVQSIGIIQAPDVMEDGRADMCDSCPDITYYEGKFINSCRMDEYRLFGGFVTVLDKDKVVTEQRVVAEQRVATDKQVAEQRPEA